MEGRDADTEAIHAANTTIAGVALRGQGELAGDQAEAGHRAEHGAGVFGPSRCAAPADDLLDARVGKMQAAGRISTELHRSRPHVRTDFLARHFSVWIAEVAMMNATHQSFSD